MRSPGPSRKTAIVDAALERARDAYDRRAWAQARDGFSSADKREPLGVEDVERLAGSAYLIGHSEEAYEAWGRAYAEWCRAGDSTRAARCGFWIGFGLVNAGEFARCGGWIDRTQRMLDDASLDCAEHGYLRFVGATKSVFEGDVAGGLEGFAAATEIADRFGSTELSTLARIGAGRCTIYTGRVADGVALLDEAMVSVGADEVSPIVAGDAYCTVIEGVYELFDLRRAQEWTAALARWCDAQPELVVYRGNCLVHRAEIMQIRGAWSEALVEVKRACSRIATSPVHVAFGAAVYLHADLQRLRGDLDSAEELFRRASDLGRDPQPGLALLRLAQGRSDLAAAAIRRAVAECEGPLARARLLGPLVEVTLALGDVASAREAVAELDERAAELNAPFVDALARHASGEVLLADGDPAGALTQLRRAWRLWQELEVPYESARVRVLTASACRVLGDDDSAEMELDAARRVFIELGAAPDVARVDAQSALPPPIPGGLTPREREVLVLIAQGKTNRLIAAELVVSEKTVASHVSHILTKLGVASRAAATAFAYEQGIVR